jgi:hypothetical protein
MMGEGGVPGQAGGNAGEVSGTQGPVFQQQEQKEIQILDRTDFVVQFIWTPTIERDRKPEDPRAAAATDPNAASADSSAVPVTTP